MPHSRFVLPKCLILWYLLLMAISRFVMVASWSSIWSACSLRCASTRFFAFFGPWYCWIRVSGNCKGVSLLHTPLQETVANHEYVFWLRWRRDLSSQVMATYVVSSLCLVVSFLREKLEIFGKGTTAHLFHAVAFCSHKRGVGDPIHVLLHADAAGCQAWDSPCSLPLCNVYSSTSVFATNSSSNKLLKLPSIAAIIARVTRLWHWRAFITMLQCRVPFQVSFDDSMYLLCTLLPRKKTRSKYGLWLARHWLRVIPVECMSCTSTTALRGNGYQETQLKAWDS